MPLDVALHRALGLTDDELSDIEGVLRREPTPSSCRCSRSCGRSTAPTSRPAGTCRACPPRASASSSGRGRTPGSSTRATGSPSRCGSSRTTTLRPSSPTRAPPRAWAASCGTSSRWAHAPCASWTPCSSATSTRPASGGCSRAWWPGSRATGTPSASQRSVGSSRSTPATSRTRSSTSCASAPCRRGASSSDGRAASATSRCSWGPRRAATGSAGCRSSPLRASLRPASTTPSARASRWATPTRRSG